VQSRVDSRQRRLQVWCEDGLKLVLSRQIKCRFKRIQVILYTHGEWLIQLERLQRVGSLQLQFNSSASRAWQRLFEEGLRAIYSYLRWHVGQGWVSQLQVQGSLETKWSQHQRRVLVLHRQRASRAALWSDRLWHRLMEGKVHKNWSRFPPSHVGVRKNECRLHKRRFVRRDWIHRVQRN